MRAANSNLGRRSNAMSLRRLCDILGSVPASELPPGAAAAGFHPLRLRRYVDELVRRGHVAGPHALATPTSIALLAAGCWPHSAPKRSPMSCRSCFSEESSSRFFDMAETRALAAACSKTPSAMPVAEA